MSRPSTQFRLYTKDAQRKFLTLPEFERFITTASTYGPEVRAFACILAYTGMRLSEVRNLQPHAVQLETRVISATCLKLRRPGVIREVPIPPPLHTVLQNWDVCRGCFLFGEGNRPVPRITAYRWIKSIMKAAGIEGPMACPKGLRHAFGTRAVMSDVPLHILQRWMGHTSMETTAIYATVLGPDQFRFSDRMWREHRLISQLQTPEHLN